MRIARVRPSFDLDRGEGSPRPALSAIFQHRAKSWPKNLISGLLEENDGAQKANLKAEIAAAKAREVEVKAVFEQYDVDESHSIEMDELTALLDDLGLLAGLKAF